ncbi:MAG: trypsin-like peptidase domain-containing protein [Chitinophagales bacterium]|nr:trypsin-like peptidase domain-containing protein [Chitinophagales bacterium]
MKTYTIGRNSEADIILTAHFCSRDHAKLTISNTGKIFLQDISSNGTTINGKKITNQTSEVNYGDEILFAGVEKLDWSKIEKPQPKHPIPAPPIPAPPFVKRYALKTVIALSSIGLLLLLFRFISGVNTSKPEMPLSATEIYNRYKNTVVLVEVKYYVRIHTKATQLYFGLKPNKEIDFNKDKSELQPLSSEGTAFFIDSNGTLITNHHVIKPWQFDRNLKDYFFTKIKPAIKKALREGGWGEDDPKFYGELEAIYIYPNGKRFTPENRIQCTELKISDDEDIDLASIQTISGSLPQGVSIISRKETEPDETKIQVGSPAFVISFPYGDELATNESNELNCTSTTGSFTQPPAKKYIQYSAQVASGSSGSPVFNQYGKLVAVTYLGSSSGQSFNRGILIKYLSMLQ